MFISVRLQQEKRYEASRSVFASKLVIEAWKMSHRLRGCWITLLVRRPKPSNNSSMRDGENEREKAWVLSLSLSLFRQKRCINARAQTHATSRHTCRVWHSRHVSRFISFFTLQEAEFFVNSSGRVRKRARFFLSLHFSQFREKAVNRLIESYRARLTIAARSSEKIYVQFIRQNRDSCNSGS